MVSFIACNGIDDDDVFVVALKLRAESQLVDQ
jgi:hypothetical protein